MHRTDTGIVAFWMSVLLVAGITVNAYGVHRHVQSTASYTTTE